MTVEPSPAPPTKADALRRVKRFASLRAAQRALAPSLRTPITVAELEAIQLLRLQVQRPLADFQTATDAGLAILDSQLDRFAAQLAAQLSEIKVSQLRATLSVETAAAKSEAAALLDLCLESEPVPDAFLHFVDYLVTMLSTEVRDDRWVVAADPADVSERVRQRCWAAASSAPRFEANLLERFSEAIRRLQQGGDVGGIRAEVESIKAENAEFLFVPEILRGVVGYNVAARNYYDSAIQRVREQDHAMDRETLLESEQALRDAIGSAEPGSVAEAVSQIQEALRSQISGASAAVPSGPLGEIVNAIRGAEMEPAERMAFAHAADDGIMNTVRSTVVMGFLQRNAGALRDPLMALGIDSTGLEALIQAFAAELQSEINGLLVENSYESARQLSEVRARHLAGVARQGSPSALPSAPRVPEGVRRPSRGAPGSGAAARQGGGRRSEPLSIGPVRRHAWLVPAVVLGLVLLFQDGPSGGVKPLSGPQLQVISRLLQSGYRDYPEDRAIFVGTLSKDWDVLSLAAQKSAADRIQGELRRKGIHEVLLYDADLNLEAHYVDEPRRQRRGWGGAEARGAKG